MFIEGTRNVRVFGLVSAGIVFMSAVAERAVVAGSDQIKKDETVILFPTTAWLEGDVWHIDIHGWVFEPEHDSTKRRALMGLLRRSLGLASDAAESSTFRVRAWPFLVDNERGKRVTVRLGDRSHVLDESGVNGHFESTFEVATGDIEATMERDGQGRRWVTLQAVLPAKDGRDFRGRVELIAPDGLSVVSDIDDTIKITEVADKKALLANTFLRDFRPVPQMAELYEQWAKQGASFQYVSASPWQLYEALQAFLVNAGYPAGSLHMKQFRWKDSTFIDLFTSNYEGKVKAIGSLIDRYPGRTFILVGDSGEDDPEVYGELARRYPARVVRVLIRQVAAGPVDSKRMKTAFDGVPSDRWTVFREPGDLPEMKGD